MSEETTQKSFMDKLTDAVMKIAAPIGRFGMLKPIASIQDGLLACMPLIIAGATWLVVYVLGSPSVGDSGHALVPFLEPLASKFAWMNDMTMSLMALYASMTIGSAYGEKLGMNGRTAGLLGLSSFIVITSGPDEGLATGNWSASGLFVSMVVSLLAVRVFSLFIEKGFTIKLPEQVPPAIGNSFAAIVPYAVVLGICWLIRTMLNIDLVAVLMGLLAPLVAGADNIFVFMGSTFVQQLLWIVGLHGDNMWVANFQPFGLMWLEENASALANGSTVFDLPHVLAAYGTGGGLARLVIWPAAAWPLVVLMLRSKAKIHRTLGATCALPAIFTIVEPVIFGLPIVLNPYLMIPFVLSGVVGAGVGYAMMALPMFGKFFVNLPWATPPFLLGPLGTGDVKSIIIVAIVFVLGLLIYLPFWRLYEKKCVEEEQGQEALEEQTA